MIISSSHQHRSLLAKSEAPVSTQAPGQAIYTSPILSSASIRPKINIRWAVNQSEPYLLSTIGRTTNREPSCFSNRLFRVQSGFNWSSGKPIGLAGFGG